MKYRVIGSNTGFMYMEMEMSKDDVIKRRASMRPLLKDTMFRNSSNETLDSIRIIAIEDNNISVEDNNGYEFYIKTSKEQDFEPAGETPFDNEKATT